MLTIKHIEVNGCESLNTAESVSFYPKGQDIGRPDLQATVDSSPQLVAFGGSCKLSGDHSTYGSGVVYVMNDAGKTVGVYELDDPRVAGMRANS